MIICPICKNKSKKIWKERQYTVWKCRNCKTSFLWPIPTNLEEIYNKRYFESWYLPYWNKRKKYFQKIFTEVEKNIKKKGKLLDIGCGVGIFLEVAKEKGWEVYGQEVSSFAIEWCRNKGLKVLDKPLPELNLPENSFDLVSMFDVIAHIREPVEYLNICKKILKPDGYLIVKTPSHSNFLFTFNKLFSFTGKTKTLLHIPAQIFHFSSLEYILEKTGFTPLKTYKLQEYNKFSIRDFRNLINFIIQFLLREKTLIIFAIKK